MSALWPASTLLHPPLLLAQGSLAAVTQGWSLAFLWLRIPTLEATWGQAPILPGSLPPQTRV